VTELARLKSEDSTTGPPEFVRQVRGPFATIRMGLVTVFFPQPPPEVLLSRVPTSLIMFTPSACSIPFAHLVDPWVIPPRLTFLFPPQVPKKSPPPCSRFKAGSFSPRRFSDSPHLLFLNLSSVLVIEEFFFHALRFPHRVPALLKLSFQVRWNSR